MYGLPPARFGSLARVEIYVNSEKEGKIEKVYLEGNLKPQAAPPCTPPPPPPPPEKK